MFHTVKVTTSSFAEESPLPEPEDVVPESEHPAIPKVIATARAPVNTFRKHCFFILSPPVFLFDKLCEVIAFFGLSLNSTHHNTFDKISLQERVYTHDGDYDYYCHAHLYRGGSDHTDGCRRIHSRAGHLLKTVGLI